MLVHRMQVTPPNLPARLPNNLAVLIHTPESRKALRGYQQPSDPEPGLETRPLDPTSCPPQPFQASKYEKNSITEKKFVSWPIQIYRSFSPTGLQFHFTPNTKTLQKYFQRSEIYEFRRNKNVKISKYFFQVVASFVHYRKYLVRRENHCVTT